MEGGERGVGRPLKFENAEELQVMIDDYFASCEEELWRQEETEDRSIVWKPILDHKGNIRKAMTKTPTMSGLAVHLGVDRKTIFNYSSKEEFFPTINAAKAKLESIVEEILLTTKSATGPIFNLKNNYGWVDKTEQDVTANVNADVKHTSNLRNLSPKELADLEQLIAKTSDSE